MESHLSQREESRIHALCKSARSQGQSEGQDCVLICQSLKGESQEPSVKGGLPGCESKHLSYPEKINRKKPVPWANLRVQVPEIEAGPEAAILFGDEEVTAVDA